MDPVDEAYVEGYKIGLFWQHDWVPGGPYHYDAATKAVNEAWMRGWKAGVKEKDRPL